MTTNKNTSETIENFLNRLISQIEAKNINRYFIYLDNASVHHEIHGIEMKKSFKSRKKELLYGVEYFQQYDFCEQIFNILKKIHYKSSYDTM